MPWAGCCEFSCAGRMGVFALLARCSLLSLKRVARPFWLMGLGGDGYLNAIRRYGVIGCLTPCIWLAVAENTPPVKGGIQPQISPSLSRTLPAMLRPYVRLRAIGHMGTNTGGIDVDQQPYGLRLENVEQVAQRIGRGRSWIYSAVRDGCFPAPVRLSTRCTRWDSRAVDLWIQNQLKEALQ